MRYVDVERSVEPEQALALVREWLEKEGLVAESSVVGEVESTAGWSLTTRAELRSRDGAFLSRSSGKGLGVQAHVSGLFEAIEHAVLRDVLPGRKRVRPRRVLQSNPSVESLDGAYYLARRLSRERPQEVAEFSRVEPDLSLSERVFLVYPALACDISSPIGDDSLHLAPLGVYSSTTGVASGCTREDALLHAINEVIERDAESKFLLDASMGVKSWQLLELRSGHPLNELFHCLTGGHENGGWIFSLDCLAGYVVCVSSEPPGYSGEPQLGFGSSQNFEVALERALTELQQCQCSIRDGFTWADEGADQSGMLEGFPNVQKVASRRLDVPRKFDRAIDRPVSGVASTDVMAELNARSVVAYGRELLNQKVGDSALCVVQVVIPGAEALNNLIFGRPMLPSGRCSTPEAISFLLERS